MTLAPGTTLGRYQILEPLGSGGMATVYKAYEPSLDRVVALKVIRPGLAEEEGFLARFRREAQAVAKLSHPNIVHVLTFDEVDGRFFLAMDYLEGGTLKERTESLAPGTLLDPAEVTSIVNQVANALAYAHGRGIVHRDIKPSNIMITEGGRAIVTDFGIAKIASGAQLTQTGVGIGTPEYMSPEQGQGGAVDARADIYSLAVVAYELLTGRVPYTAETPFAVVAAHMRDPLPLPSSINPAIPAPAERALLKALAKQPAQRFATPTEFAAALSDGLRGAPAAATMATILPVGAAAKPDTRSFTFSLPALPRSRPALAAIGAAALVVVAGTGALVSGSFGRGEVAPSAVASPAAPSASTSGAAPKFAIPAKGALIWQAKLDGTDIDTRSGSQVAAGADPTATDVRYVPGAIEFVQIRASTSGRSIQLNSPVRESFVLEVDVDPVAAHVLDLQWWDTGQRYGMGIDAKAGRVQLEFSKRGAAPEPLTPSTPADGIRKGNPFTVAVVVERTRFTAYVDQKQIVQVGPDGRVAPAATPIGIIFNGTPDPGALRLTGIRLYELPAAAAAGPSFDSLHSAAFYEAKFDGVAADLSNFSPADRVKVGSGQLTMTATDVPVGPSTSATPQTSPAVQYALDVTVQFAPGSEGSFSTCIRRTLTQGTTTFPSPGATYCLVLTTTPEVLELTYSEPTGTGTTRSETIGGAITVPGARTRAIHVAIVVDRQTFTVFVDDMSKPAMVRTDSRLTTPTSPVGFLVSRLRTDPNTAATVTIRDLKLYRLP